MGPKVYSCRQPEDQPPPVADWCTAIVYLGDYPLSLYNDIVLDHYQNPRNVGVLDEADAVGIAENSACGDVLHLYLQIRDDHVAAASFKTFGCAAAIAAGSMLTEMVTGSSIEQIRSYTKQDVVDALGGLPPMKVHCSVLAEDAIKAAVEDYRSKALRSR